MNNAAFFLNLQIHPTHTYTHCLSQGSALTAVAFLFPLCVLTAGSIVIRQCVLIRMHVKKAKQHWKKWHTLQVEFCLNTIDCIRVISWASINNIQICYYIRVFMNFHLSVLRKEWSPSKLVHHSFSKILRIKFLHCFLSFWYHTYITQLTALQNVSLPLH